MHRVLAIIERELRRLRRAPVLIFMSLLFPTVQLVILGHAFGGKVKHLKVGLVDQDHGVPAVRLRELSNAVSANAQTFELVPYDDPGNALTALRNGRLNGVLTIPPGFRRRLLGKNGRRVAWIADNTDNFVSATLAGTMSGLLGAYNARPTAPRIATQPTLELVEGYPFVPYVQYLMPGLIVMWIFMSVIIGGGIIYLDDKARGLHEGYLVTPISKFELILGFNVSGAIKAALVGARLRSRGVLSPAGP